MAEQLINEFTVNLPVDEAWTVLTDIERIAPCVPGAELHEVVAGEHGDTFRGVVKVKFGSIAPQYQGQAELVERDDVGHRAVIRAEGRDTGDRDTADRGTASAEITAVAERLSPTSTHVTLTTDLNITGKVAQLGLGIISDVARKLIEQFSGNLNELLDDQQPSPAGTGDAGNTPRSAGHDAHSAGHDAASSSADETPLVRRIDGPASEPVDLADVAGPAILKRLAPVLALVTILLVLARKRR